MFVPRVNRIVVRTPHITTPENGASTISVPHLPLISEAVPVCEEPGFFWWHIIAGYPVALAGSNGATEECGAG